MGDFERSISLSLDIQGFMNLNVEIEQIVLSLGSDIIRDDDSLVIVI